MRRNCEESRRCIPVHYSNCPTGTQQCVAEMRRHCSKVFKKRDPAINPMNMGSRGPRGQPTCAARILGTTHEQCRVEQCRIHASFVSFPPRRMMRRACIVVDGMTTGFQPLVAVVNAGERAHKCTYVCVRFYFISRYFIIARGVNEKCAPAELRLVARAATIYFALLRAVQRYCYKYLDASDFARR